MLFVSEKLYADGPPLALASALNDTHRPQSADGLLIHGYRRVGAESGSDLKAVPAISTVSTPPNRLNCSMPGLVRSQIDIPARFE